MSNSFRADSDQYIIIDTEVTIGKSYKSRGWALSRVDINDWLPVQEFEKECNVIIDKINSEAKLRFNPRLFYESDELSMHLEELYDKGYSKKKIPMKIRIPKNNLYKNLKGMHSYNVEHIDTELLVGKSYSSGGWQLSKDVVSKLFPSNEYSDEYLICIDNITSKAKLNLQFRLFYKSNSLSNHLEDLYYENPKQKVDAKIIFEVNSSRPYENEESEILEEKELDEEFPKNICKICSNPYDFSQSSDEDYCSDCLEKIKALKIYNIIKNSSFSNFIKKEFVEEELGSNFEDSWDLLIKYNFLTPLGDLFKLSDNDIIEQNYSEYLSGIPIKTSHKKRNKRKIYDLINQEDDSEENICPVCGTILNEYGIDKCESCSDKQLATEYLHDMVTKVPYKKNFSKYTFASIMGISSLDANLILEKLLKYDLLLMESDIFYKLNDVSFLNDFVNKYSNSKYELQINYEADNSSIPSLSKSDLSSEERIDSLIRWYDFNEFISFKKGQYGFVSVQFKQDGVFLYSKGFSTAYEAKVEAIKYLKSLGEIKLIEKGNIKLEFK